MKNWIAHRYGAGSDLRKLPLDLKRCPLCGTINAASNGECVTCAWSGEFEHDQETIEDGLYEMLMRCPELADALVDCQWPPAPKRVSFWSRLMARFRRRIDYSA